MSSYYQIIDGQRYDRSLLTKAEALTHGQGDGRISEADATALLKAAHDGRGITATEKRTLRYIAKNFRLTGSAQNIFQEALGPISPEENDTAEDYVFLARQHLSSTYGIERVSLVIDPQQVAQQSALISGQLSFSAAFEKAMQTLYADDEDLESPLSIISEVYELFPEEVANAEAQIRAKLDGHLEQGELSLLPIYDVDDYDTDLDFNPPENRETVEENWIFSLYLPQLSDHVFWIIVPRNGRDAYVYGFN